MEVLPSCNYSYNTIKFKFNPNKFNFKYGYFQAAFNRAFKRGY